MGPSKAENEKVRVTLTLTQVSPSHPDARLADKIRTIKLDSENSSIVLGRASKNRGLVAGRGNLWIDSPIVTKEHARFMLGSDPNHPVILRDLNSTHGTWVGDRQIKMDYPLQDGDMIKIGTDVTSGMHSYTPHIYLTEAVWHKVDHPLTPDTQSPTSESSGFAVPEITDESDIMPSDLEKSLAKLPEQPNNLRAESTRSRQSSASRNFEVPFSDDSDGESLGDDDTSSEGDSEQESFWGPGCRFYEQSESDSDDAEDEDEDEEDDEVDYPEDASQSEDGGEVSSQPGFGLHSPWSSSENSPSPAPENNPNRVEKTNDDSLDHASNVSVASSQPNRPLFKRPSIEEISDQEFKSSQQHQHQHPPGRCPAWCPSKSMPAGSSVFPPPSAFKILYPPTQTPIIDVDDDLEEIPKSVFDAANNVANEHTHGLSAEAQIMLGNVSNDRKREANNLHTFLGNMFPRGRNPILDQTIKPGLNVPGRSLYDHSVELDGRDPPFEEESIFDPLETEWTFRNPAASLQTQSPLASSNPIMNQQDLNVRFPLYKFEAEEAYRAEADDMVYQPLQTSANHPLYPPGTGQSSNAPVLAHVAGHPPGSQQANLAALKPVEHSMFRQPSPSDAALVKPVEPEAAGSVPTGLHPKLSQTLRQMASDRERSISISRDDLFDAPHQKTQYKEGPFSQKTGDEPESIQEASSDRPANKPFSIAELINSDTAVDSRRNLKRKAGESETVIGHHPKPAELPGTSAIPLPPRPNFVTALTDSFPIAMESQRVPLPMEGSDYVPEAQQSPQPSEIPSLSHQSSVAQTERSTVDSRDLSVPESEIGRLIDESFDRAMEATWKSAAKKIADNAADDAVRNIADALKEPTDPTSNPWTDSDMEDWDPEDYQAEEVRQARIKEAELEECEAIMNMHRPWPTEVPVADPVESVAEEEISEPPRKRQKTNTDGGAQQQSPRRRGFRRFVGKLVPFMAGAAATATAIFGAAGVLISTMPDDIQRQARMEMGG